MDTLAQAAQFVRAYGIRLATSCRTRPSCGPSTGAMARSDLFDNLGAEIVFGTADPELTKELEERLGDATVTITTRNRPRFHVVAELVEAGGIRPSPPAAADAGPGGQNAGSGPATDHPPWHAAGEDQQDMLVS